MQMTYFKDKTKFQNNVLDVILLLQVSFANESFAYI